MWKFITRNGFLLGCLCKTICNDFMKNKQKRKVPNVTLPKAKKNELDIPCLFNSHVFRVSLVDLQS